MKRKRSQVRTASNSVADAARQGSGPGQPADEPRLPAALRRALGLCFFLSGAATLSLEVVWSKVLGQVLGNSTQAVGTVVAAFMAGLALGSALAARLARRIADPLRAYARIEAVLALCAVASVPLLRATVPLFQVVHRALAGGHAAFLGVRFALVFALLLLPATLMGMTLPVMVGVFGRRRQSYERDAGLLYGLNTLGAVAGTLAAGFLLIPALGLFGTACASGGIQATVAAIAGWSRRVHGVRAPVAAPGPAIAGERPRAAFTPAQRLIVGAFALSGALAMLYEVAWFRLLALVTGPSVGAFATLLAVFLLALAAGSLLASARVERASRPLAVMAWLQLAIGFAVLGGLAVYDRLPGLYLALVPGAGQAGAQLAVAALVLGVPCLAMGAQFPFAVRALVAAGPRRSPEQDVGRLYVANTVGGIAGSLAGAFWALPGAGLHATFARASLFSVGLGALLALAGTGRRALRLSGAAVVAAAALVAFLPGLDTGALNQGRYLQRPGGDASDDETPQILFHREGVATSVSVFRTEGHVDLRVAGKVDASNSPGDLRTQLFVGALPTLLARNPRRVAVIGYGSGMSAGAALAQAGVESVDVLEIEPAVVEASDFFAGINGRPLSDPRTRVILEDGRTHLTYTDRVYDAIASEPSNPWMAGVADLFTTDFYRIARARLAPGGVFGQWIQLYALSDEVFEAMLASLHEVFPHVALFLPEPTDLVAIASSEPLALDWDTLRARFAAPGVHAAFAALGLRNPAHLLAHLCAGPAQTRELVAHVRRRNTDDNTWLERRLGRDFVRLREHHVATPLSARLQRARLPAMRELFPGLPALEVAREVVGYLRDQEPRLGGERRVVDEWAEARRGVGAGLVLALQESGETEAAADLRELVATAEEDWRGREEATRLIVQATLGGGGDVRAAVARALELAPDLPAALWTAAELAAGRDDVAAEAYLRRALGYPWHRVHTDVVLSLATLLARTGRADQALALLDELCERNPYWVRPQALRVRLLQQAGRLDEARRRLDEALRFNPRQPDLLALDEALAAG